MLAVSQLLAESFYVSKEKEFLISAQSLRHTSFCTFVLDQANSRSCTFSYIFSIIGIRILVNVPQLHLVGCVRIMYKHYARAGRTFSLLAVTKFFFATCLATLLSPPLYYYRHQSLPKNRLIAF